MASKQWYKFRSLEMVYIAVIRLFAFFVCLLKKLLTLTGKASRDWDSLFSSLLWLLCGKRMYGVENVYSLILILLFCHFVNSPSTHRLAKIIKKVQGLAKVL